MEAVVKKFRTFEEAEEADLKYYRSLSPQERLEMLFEIRRMVLGKELASGQMARVCRIRKLGERE